MSTICGMDCCGQCEREKECGGCEKVDGHPFGGTCIAAECIKKNGMKALAVSKQLVMDEINALGIKDLHVEELYLLNGFRVNLEYTLPNGQSVKLLDDNNVYWGSQIEIPDSDRCYGVIADEEYLIISEYGCGGTDARIIMYKKR